MKKFYYLLVSTFISVISFGQMTFPFEENFDTFYADSKFVQQVTSTTVWTTWSNAPGGTEDPIVSDTYANSAENSIMISTNNDLVLLTGNKTEGRYLFSFNMYVPDGKLAYFNMLQEFSGSNSKWAYQIMFNGGEATVQGATEDYFAFENDKWFEMKTIVDLDEDWCEIYKDGDLVYEFQWSIGTSATNTKQMSAINFYGWDNEGTGEPEYYFDDVLIKTIESPESPSNLTAEITNGNDITLTWNAPATQTPAGYSIYKNGNKIAENVTSLTFNDENVYPQTFNYSVRAFYNDLGLSASATTEITVEGGVPRNTVLFEIGTGTWCTYCPGAARGIDKLVDEGKNISVIEYHYGDYYQTDEGLSRINYYAIDGYPTAVVDGTTKITGGSLTGSMYNSYLGVYENAIDIPVVVKMDMSISKSSPTSGKVIVNAEETFKYFESGLVLRFAITESHIEDSWFNMDEVNFVCRDMLVGSDGLNVDFSSSNTQSFEVDFTLPEWNENLNLVAFIQHDGSKSVAQAITSVIPETTPQPVTLTFNVDMSQGISLGNFVPGTDVIYVTGNFNGWDEPGSGESIELTDVNSDQVYTGSVMLTANYGEVQYKYFKNAGWVGGEWAGEPNRLITIGSDDVTVNDIWAIAGLNEVNLDAVTIAPNPFNEKFVIANAEKAAQIVVSNVLGQVVMTVNKISNHQEISTQNLSKGVYFVTIIDSNKLTRTERVVKQ